MKALRPDRFLWNPGGRYWYARRTDDTMAFAHELCDIPIGMSDRAESVEQFLKRFRHICWYPSAGADLRPLLYLSEGCYRWKNVPIEEGQSFPDLYIFTDYSDTTKTYFVNDINIKGLNSIRHGVQPQGPLIECGRNATRITALKTERLPDLAAEVDTSLITRDASERIGNVFHVKAQVDSNQLGSRNVDFLYILCENTAFARDVLLANDIRTEYVVQVRYGNGFGGSGLAGDWIKHILKKLGCRYFIGEPEYMERNAFVDEEKAAELFPGKLSEPSYERFYGVDDRLWSHRSGSYNYAADVHAEGVNWYRIK